MRKLFCVLTLCAALFPAFGEFDAIAAEKEQADNNVSAKKEWKNNFKFYGFIRNFFAFDTRESLSGTGNLFYYIPKDQNINEQGDDLNAQGSFRFLALTTRLGVDVSGYKFGNTYFGAKVEGDFYTGLQGSTGTANARMRQAYVTLGWKDLKMAGDDKASVNLKIGQAWHPMAADLPQVFCLESGAPFGPFSRTPQVTMDANLGRHWTLTGSLLWQMQYTSAGPSWDAAQKTYVTKKSADYIKYSCTPEAYVGLTYQTAGFLVKAGVDVLSIRPRIQGFLRDGSGELQTDQPVKVNDRITTVSPLLFMQYKYKNFLIKAKTVYGSAGEHMSLNSGYVKVGENENGSWDYAPLHSSSSWMSISYGSKWKGVLFLGYMKNLGLAHEQADGVNAGDIFFSNNGYCNISQMYRINPEVLLTLGKFQLGLEWQYTAVQYGDKSKLNKFALPTENLHWIANNRVQVMVKFNF